MSYYADPDSYGGHSLTTDADVTRARRLAAQLAVLFPDPAGNGRRLPADAASSASRCGEALLHAGGDGSAVVSRPT